MNRKKILIVVIIISSSLLCFLGYNVITKIKEKNSISQQLKIVPEFKFFTLEQKPFTKTNLKPKTKTIFIYFNSECDFCQHEAQSIGDNLDNFENVQFIFVSTENIASIQQFSKQYKLNNHQNITFLNDKLNIFSSQFGASSIPYMLIYDKNQKLIKKHKGQLNAKGILRVLNIND